MNEEKKHAKYSPSSASRIIGCPASVKLSEGIPNISSKYAEEGTEAHVYFEKTIINYSLGQGMIDFHDNDMQDALAQTLNFVHEKTKHLRDRKFYTEHHVKMKVIDDDCSGTCDLIIESPFNEIYIFDYKHGQNKRVDVKDNAQMMAYAVGALTDEKGNWDESYEKIFIGVLQPRMDNLEVIEVTLDYLKAFASLFKEAIFLAKLECATNPGPWCQFCPVKQCPSKRQKYLEVFTSAINAEETKELNHKMVEVLRNKKLALQFIDEVEEKLLEQLKAGVKIEGVKLGKSRGTKKFLGPAESKLHDVAFAWKRELLGVSAVEKLLKKNKVDIDLSDVIQITHTEKVVLDKGDNLLEAFDD